LQRRAFTKEQKHLIKEAYHLIYDFDSHVELAIQQLVDTLPMTIEIQHIVDFLKNSICIIDK
jgi:UDP-N-acetylglucosamine acyltransferase